MSDEKPHTSTADKQGSLPTDHNDIRPKRSVTIGFVFVLSVIAILSVAFLWYQSNTQYKTLLQQQQQLTQQWQQTQTLQSQLTTDNKQLHTAQRAQNERIEQQQNTLTDMDGLINQNTQTWRLARIDYLIQLANYQAIFMHNAAEAIALLKAANKEVMQAKQPQWLPLANALHQDINTFSAIPVLNISDTLSQLNALDGQLNQLPLNVAHFSENAMKPPASETVIPMNTTSIRHWAWWKARFQLLWQELRGVLIIRHNNKSIIPIVDAQQQAYLRQNVHLMLFQVKWAVINHDNALYHLSLNQLTQWIHDYFNVQSPVTKTILANIDALQKLTLTPTLPTIDKSITALQTIMEQDNANLHTHQSVEIHHPASISVNNPALATPPANTQTQIKPAPPRTIQQPEVTDS